MNDFSQHRALRHENSREYRKDFERCIERCDDRRERDEDYDRHDRKEIERDFDKCEERCEEDRISDVRRDAELEADLDEYLNIHYPDIEGSVTIQYADLDDEDDDEVKIRFRIKYGPDSCNDCRLVIVDGDTCFDLDDDEYYLLDTEVEFDEGEAKDSLDFELNRVDLEDFECKYVALLRPEHQNRKLRGVDTSSQPSSRNLKNHHRNELQKIDGDVSDKRELVACGQLVPRRSSRSRKSSCRRH
jgi:hypothetical protein